MDSINNTTTVLQETLNTLEVDRKKIAATYINSYILFGIAIVVIVVGLFIGVATVAVVLALIPIIVGAVMLFRLNDEVEKYKIAFKMNVLESSLKTINESLSIVPQSGLPEYEFISSELFSTEPDRYKTQDLISGIVDKTSFWFAEVHAEYEKERQTKNGTRTEWLTIFKGIIFVADFNKNFAVSTIVRPKTFGDSIGAWFSKNIVSFGSTELVQLENSAFNNQFATYSGNQIEARYILTPTMMERILSLNNKSDDTISLSFINSKMYIAFPLSTNYFEAPIYKSLLASDLLTDDLSIVEFMHNIVHDLDLNTRIWGKE